MELTGDRAALINGLLDFLLDNVQLNATTLKSYRNVPIHDLVKKLELDLSLTSLSASLKACQGSLSDLTTIRRVGDATLSSQGNTIFIGLTITLDLLQLTFNKYTLQVSLFKISGDRLQLNVKENLFDLFLVIHFNGLEVEMYFDKFKLAKFRDIDVDITGFGVLNPIARNIADWIVDYFNDYIVKEVAEPYAKKIFNSAIDDKDFLRRLFGYAISGMVRGASLNTMSTPTSSSENTETNPISSEDYPVAPLRQRRNVSRVSDMEQRNNLSAGGSSQHQNNNLTFGNNLQQKNAVHLRPTVPQRNNIRLQTVPSQPDGSVNPGPRTPEVTVRNNLAARKNEIILQPKKSFFSRSPKVVEADHILPVKPPML